MKQIFELKKSPVAKKSLYARKKKILAKPFFFFFLKTFSIIETSSLLESSPRHFFDSQKMKLERKHFFFVNIQTWEVYFLKKVTTGVPTKTSDIELDY
jgi:hypothetical protein